MTATAPFRRIPLYDTPCGFCCLPAVFMEVSGGWCRVVHKPLLGFQRVCESGPRPVTEAKEAA